MTKKHRRRWSRSIAKSKGERDRREGEEKRKGKRRKRKKRCAQRQIETQQGKKKG